MFRATSCDRRKTSTCVCLLYNSSGYRRRLVNKKTKKNRIRYIFVLSLDRDHPQISSSSTVALWTSAGTAPSKWLDKRRADTGAVRCGTCLAPIKCGSNKTLASPIFSLSDDAEEEGKGESCVATARGEKKSVKRWMI